MGKMGNAPTIAGFGNSSAYRRKEIHSESSELSGLVVKWKKAQQKDS